MCEVTIDLSRPWMIVVYILKHELSYKLYRRFPIEIYTGSLTCFKKLICSDVLTISALEPVTILSTEVNQQGLFSNVTYVYMYIYVHMYMYIYICMYVYIYMYIYMQIIHRYRHEKNGTFNTSV